MPSDVYQTILEYGFNLIAKKRYTSGELRKKLIGKLKKLKDDFQGRQNDSAPEKIVEEVISRLKELDYINDDLFVQDYIADRLRFRPRGILAIKIELYKKGVEKELIEKYLNKENVDESEAAMRILNRYEKKLNGLSEKDAKRKIFQYLAGKGFSQDTIYKTIESFYNCNVI